MPRTYGEVCPSSFADLLSLGGDTNKVLIDCGSGHGVLVKAAVEQFNCIFAIGIEKYKEPAAIAAQLFTSSCGGLQAKMRFLLEDMNDTDIPQQLHGLSFTTLILFCNNLAFHEGTVHRYACQPAQHTVLEQKTTITKQSWQCLPHQLTKTWYPCWILFVCTAVGQAWPSNRSWTIFLASLYLWSPLGP